MELDSFSSDPSDSMLSILRTVFRSFPQPWVWEYLLNPDGASDTITLLTPANVRSAVAFGPRRYAFIPSPSSDHGSADLRTRYIQVPAFCLDGIVVGIIVADVNDRTGLMWSKEVRRAPRFAYHIESATYLDLTIDPEDNFVILQDITYLSAALRRRSALYFTKEKFLATFAVRWNGVDVDALRSALIWASLAKEHRQCPECGAEPDKWCGCRFPVNPLRHPLDFQNMVLNFERGTGLYSGVFSFDYFREHLQQSRMEHQVRIEGEEAVGLATRLLEWAVRSRLQMSAIHPRACSFSSNAVEILQQMIRESEIESGSLEEFPAQSSKGVVNVNTSRKYDSSLNLGAFLASSSGQRQIVGSTIAPELALSLLDDDGDTDRLFWHNRQIDQNKLAKYFAHVIRTADTETLSAFSAVQSSPGDDIENPNQVPSTGTSAFSGRVSGNQAIVALRMSAAEVETSQVIKELLSIERKEARKKRNREAATRSNLRRKLQNAAKKVQKQQLE